MHRPEMPFLEKNAAGAWYTTGYCTACGAPEDQAPTLLAPLTDDQLDTFFIRQPTTPAEVEAACRAAQVCCTSALRYGGQDPEIIKRLGNTPEFCDYLVSRAGSIVPAPLPWPPRPRLAWLRRLWNNIMKLRRL